MTPPNGGASSNAIVYLSLLVSQIIIGALLYGLSTPQSNYIQESTLVLGVAWHRLVVGFLLIFAILTAVYLRSQLAQRQEKPDAATVKNTQLIAWLLLEMANIATVVLASLQHDRQLFLVFFVGLMAFAWMRPATWLYNSGS